MNTKLSDNIIAASASRAAGLERLEAFVPHAGREYAARRNYDFGPGRHEAVSCLSPFIRHRLVSEAEVAHKVLAAHKYDACEKYIQEVMWRTWSKGWLEMRPGVWLDYCRQRDRIERTDAIRRAEAGDTGIECFDTWARELVETGYLHNHARMWFASIWIFTLGLPWAAGADFFMRHLLDGDPASNTLGWRWVAGIQTKGKTYLARPDNIERYTNGRFEHIEGLADDAPALEEENPPGKPVPPPEADTAPGKGGGPVALVLPMDDLSGHQLVPDGLEIAGTVVLDATENRSSGTVSSLVTGFAEAAARDALGRIEARTRAPGEYMRASMHDAALDWVEATGATNVIAPWAPVGPDADALSHLARDLEARGIRFHRLRREWDSWFWPHATKGFFPFKEKIPAGLRALGVI